MNPLPSWMRETPEGIIIDVKAQPGASRDECLGIQGDALKIRVTAPPVDSAANKALVKFLSKTIRIPRSRISIIKGKTSRHKQILLSGANAADLVPLLNKPGDA